MKHNHPKIEVMDTTLRDGEQTGGVSFVPHEKLMIARLLLEELKVDRVEVASARVSEGEFDAVKMICDWAARRDMLSRVEVLGFVDGHTSVDWIHAAGCRVINLLCKGSLKHCSCQLKKSPEEHIADIQAAVGYANKTGMEVNVYLEDWSNGMKESPEYVFQLMDALVQTGIKRYMLPDTLGVLNPLQVIEFMRKMVKRYPYAHFDFHAHNDYDLAVSNVLAAVLSGCKGLHTTINGLGERAGNAPLASVQAILKDHFSAVTNIDESRLNDVSRVVESYSGIVIPANKPIVGENVFTQVAGVHADGDNKSNLYCNDLLPERFGRKREYALGKTSGKANIRKNLEDLGLDLDEESMRKVTERIIELGDKKEQVTQEDLPYIVSDVLKHGIADERVKLKSYIVNLAYGLKPMATLKIEINGREYEESSGGDGQYDAFVRALRKIYKQTLGRKFPMLTNYAVTIPPGGRTDAFVQTVITWSFEDKVFRTRGLDADQTEAAIKATVKMLNIIEKEYEV
ncbi:alpha-isopropylmalate synthase regulatory domain-containing protein [uncultured Bacteroides sp.]|uniref:alpha-isopropylmalate synthase regulatory domain-containing protein n=1 Tax=uncultured Bacteroides sp. TaxID=162156 RepID=UPI0025DBE9AD|nr:alpha-isopropylmalate synthase regulatory domain-containing protein [uncultured Bacteroides sp.]